jgi:branched-chain amino acid transport system substrate-binding protein
MIRTIKSVSATALALALLGGVGHAQTIKIGVNQPLTGPFAASGNYVVNGAQIAADEINAKGGVLGKKIELVVEDNKSNPTEAANVAEKMITRDKTPIMMGAWGSNLTLAVMPKLIEYEIPMVIETSSADKITVLGNPYVFRISAPASVEAEAFKDMVGKLGFKKVDFLVINNDWGRSTVEDFSKVLKEKGVGVGLAEMMDQVAQDMSAQLVKIKSSDSDAIIVTAPVDQLTLILKQAAALGIKKHIVTTGGAQNPDQLIAQAGSAANGTMHLTTFPAWFPEKTANPEATKYLIEQCKKRGFPVGGVTESFRGYDGIRTAAAAIEKAGKAEPGAIKDALWQISVKGLNGEIKFNKVGPKGNESGQSRPNMYLVAIVDGKVELKSF